MASHLANLTSSPWDNLQQRGEGVTLQVHMNLVPAQHTCLCFTKTACLKKQKTSQTTDISRDVKPASYVTNCKRTGSSTWRSRPKFFHITVIVIKFYRKHLVGSNNCSWIKGSANLLLGFLFWIAWLRIQQLAWALLWYCQHVVKSGFVKWQPSQLQYVLMSCVASWNVCQVWRLVDP